MINAMYYPTQIPNLPDNKKTMDEIFGEGKRLQS
jgi:hypothetical protein